jgi:hypothetical protein
MKTVNEIVQEISAEYVPLLKGSENYEVSVKIFEMALADAIRMALQQHLEVSEEDNLEARR